MEFSFGQLLDVGRTGQLNQFRFQNYAVGQSVGAYSFLPFGFGGAMATLQGDNLDATLQFGNTEITRNFVVEALDNTYVAKVTTVLWNSSTYAVERTLYEYFGACSAGGWDETKIQLKLNSVLDAVQANVPGRRLAKQQVGNIPFTSQVRV
ncbi:MAG: hypothetical protein DWQ28_08005 [Proteobacteria bacterium]|nr:MAG: hypothetical protein DWQ28_08005 [Pseudomonadota bacterium]